MKVDYLYLRGDSFISVATWSPFRRTLDSNSCRYESYCYIRGYILWYTRLKVKDIRYACVSRCIML